MPESQVSSGGGHAAGAAPGLCTAHGSITLGAAGGRGRTLEGNGGNHVTRGMPPERGHLCGRVGRDGAGPGDEQPAAGCRYGHGRGGQRLPEL